MMIFGIISNAGNARSLAFEAIEAGENDDFEKATALVTEGREALGQAHVLQTQMIQAEARGEHVEVNIILVHAQDHLTAAETELNMAEKFIKLYQKLNDHLGGK